jgi:soluble lytic murein transglycosylase-like protein
LLTSYSSFIRLVVSVGLCLVVAGQAALAQEAAARSTELVPALQAYREVVAWGLGVSQDQMADYIVKNAERLDRTYANIERAAYRYGITPEFALAVISAESRYGAQISWARHDSWSYYEKTSGQKVNYPHAYDDLATAFSELSNILNDSKTIDDAFRLYWCGPQGDFNSDSLVAFSEAASKIWNGLDTYARQRKEAENRNKYQRTDSGYETESHWGRLAQGDLSGYRSQLNSMPALAEQLREFGEHETMYAQVIQHVNKNLSDDESRVIARAILTYCQQTSYGDHQEFWVDPRLIMAIVWSESAFRPRAVSKVGALGLGQLMPATAKSFGIRDPFDPIQNLYGCVKYNEREMYRWRDQANYLELVIASYNAGAGAVQKYGGIPPYRETQNFVAIVKKRYFGLAPDMKEKYERR